MFDRSGRDGRLGQAKRQQHQVRLGVESLEGRALMTASIQPIAAISSPQYQGYQVPVLGGTTHNQTYTVSSDNPLIRASVAQGNFLTIGVAHTSSGTGDIDVNGTMTFKLFQDLTPNTIQKIEGLVTGTATGLASGVTLNGDYYVGKNFHRILSGFPDANSYIVQGGSLNGDGSGSAFAAPYPDEFSQQLAFTGSGQLALANTISDTNDAGFFITTGSPTFLNYHHTIFGQIVSGQSTLQQLTQVAKDANGKPTSSVLITAASLSADNPSTSIHVDTTQAPAGATGNVTVTATDVTDGSTTSESFPVTVAAFDATNPSRPFIGQYDPTINIASGQGAVFQINGVATPPTDPITYTVQGGVSSNATNATFTPVQNATATVSATGLVTVTPTAGYTGAITVLVGVRDNVNRGGSTIDAPANYQTHQVTINVASSTTALPLRPTAAPVTATATVNSPTPIQLQGTAQGTTTGTQPLVYTVLTQPTNGTITGFDAATGTLTYTPTGGFTGTDTFQYSVTNPNIAATGTVGQTSFPATVTINVTQANTGAVRFIADDGSTTATTPGTLIVTPLPRPSPTARNTIGITQTGAGNIAVTVNGITDLLQPAAGNVDSIIVYGSKANDRITIDPSVAAVVTLDGGRGGRNVLAAGGGATRQHGWYGTNVLKQGESNNYLLGRKGRVTFVKGNGTSDVIFAGVPGRKLHSSQRVRILPTQTSGTFLKFAGRRLVETSNPYGKKHTTTTVTNSARPTDPTTSMSTETTSTVTKSAVVTQVTPSNKVVRAATRVNARAK